MYYNFVNKCLNQRPHAIGKRTSMGGVQCLNGK